MRLPGVVIVTLVVGTAVIAAAGAGVSAVWSVSWADGIGAVCVACFLVWLAVAVLLFARWVVRGTAPVAARIAVTIASAGLVFAGAWFEVDYQAYDGCNWIYGEQPVLAVPVSFITEEPAWAGDSIFTARRCGVYEGRAFEVGPFGEVPRRGS